MLYGSQSIIKRTIITNNRFVARFSFNAGSQNNSITASRAKVGLKSDVECPCPLSPYFTVPVLSDISFHDSFRCLQQPQYFTIFLGYIKFRKRMWYLAVFWIRFVFEFLFKLVHTLDWFYPIKWGASFDGRRLYIASCGVRSKWLSGRRTSSYQFNKRFFVEINPV